jgi:myosin-crossreactive antigen
MTNGGCVENSSPEARIRGEVRSEIKEGGGWDMWRKIAAQDPSLETRKNSVATPKKQLDERDRDHPGRSDSALHSKDLPA